MLNNQYPGEGKCRVRPKVIREDKELLVTHVMAMAKLGKLSLISVCWLVPHRKSICRYKIR